MKAGVCSYCFNTLFNSGEMTMPDAIRFVGNDTVADCFEPLSRFWDPNRDENEQARETRDLMRELGLETSCYALVSNFSIYEEAANRECIDLCIKRLETTAILEADTMRLDPRTTLPMPQEEADADEVISRMAEGMAEIADAAAEKGIQIGVENHGRLLGRIAQTAQIIEAVNRPNFGINIDFTNFLSVFGEDHIEATRIFANQVVHAHAKDFHITDKPGENDGWREIPTGQFVKRAVGGEGDADWPGMFGILKNAGYQGTVSLEVWDPDDIRGSIAKGAANLKSTLNELEN